MPMFRKPPFPFVLLALFVGIASALLLIAPAHAQPLPDALPTSSPELDLIEQAIGAVARRDWHVLVMVGLGAVMFVLRTYGGRLVEALHIDTHVGGVVTNFLVGGLSVYVVAMKLRQPTDLHLFLLAVTTALAAAGGWHALVKPFIEWRQARKVPEAVVARRARAAAALERLPATATVEEEHAAVQAALAGQP
jgi:undecaprenyl pyrophosphate phosphatase UppP